MSVYPFCAQCKRKTTEKIAIFHSYCCSCDETLCLNCSKAHTSVKGFSCHKLIESTVLLSQSITPFCHCKVHFDKILIWYCSAYDVYLCEECEKNSKCDVSTCNGHICFNENPDPKILDYIKIRLEGEMTKIKNILDICYKSRKTNEEELTNQISKEFCSETTSEDDKKDKKVLDECLENITLERKGIEILQEYRKKCQNELKFFLRIYPSLGMLSLIMNISNLKQDILRLYTSLKKNTIQFEDRLIINCTPICEAKNLVMKSFRIESKTFLQVDEVRKVVLIESDVVVVSPYKIQRYNSSHELENERLFPSTDSAYIPKLDLLAILNDEYDNFEINFMNVVTFDIDKHPLKLQKQPHQLKINAIAASSDYIYYAGLNCSGRIHVPLNGEHLLYYFNGEVGNEMIINNNQIFIPFGRYIRIYSLSFQLLRSLSGETLEQGNQLDAQQSFPNAVVYSMNHQVPHQQNLPWNYQQSFNVFMMPSLRQSNQAANFISMTTDQDNNVYAVNTNSQDITRWNHLNNKWDPIITSCHGSRCPSSLTFDEQFSYAYVCVEDSNSIQKYLLKYKVIWDFI